MSWDLAGAAVQAEGDSFASLERRKMKELQAVMQSRRVGGGPSVPGAEPLLAKPVLQPSAATLVSLRKAPLPPVALSRGLSREWSPQKSPVKSTKLRASPKRSPVRGPSLQAVPWDKPVIGAADEPPPAPSGKSAGAATPRWTDHPAPAPLVVT